MFDGPTKRNAGVTRVERPFNCAELYTRMGGRLKRGVSVETRRGATAQGRSNDSLDARITLRPVGTAVNAVYRRPGCRLRPISPSTDVDPGLRARKVIVAVI
jgi:hypothetical protein